MAKNQCAETVAEGIFKKLEPEEEFRITRSKLNAELQRYRDYLGYDDDDCSMRKCQDALYQMIRIHYRDVGEKTTSDGRSFIGIGFKHEVEMHRAEEEQYQKDLKLLNAKAEAERKRIEEERQQRN